MAGPWQKAWEKARTRPTFLDLTDSRFHQNGLLPPRELFETRFAQWLDQRAYEPDSRGDPRARLALCEHYQALGFAVTPDQFFLTAGTSEAYALLFSTLANAGDSVALPRPGYPLFEHLAKHSRLETVYYDQPWSAQWQPDAASLEACLGDRTRFVVVISPNNPTGQVAAASSLRAVAELCLRRDLVLIVDEVFDACYQGPEPLPRPGALFPEVKTVTLNGISKRFGSPDLKLAWAAVTGPNRWVNTVSAELELANDTFLSANSFSQFLLPSLFTELGPWQDRLRAQLAVNRDEAARWMHQQPGVSGILPAGGIHGLWRFDLSEEWDDESWSVNLLDAADLALHPGYFYDVQEPGVWLVYSLLKEPEAFRTGLERLTKRLSSVGRGPSSLR